MAAITAVLDACVLYPAPLRDLLLRLALADLFRARWSASIHEEWIAGVLRHRPDLTRAQLDRTRALMDAHAADSLVEGFEQLIPSIELPDPRDRHVVAAAIQSGASLIVTANLADFPRLHLAPHAIAAVHPDAFVVSLMQRAPETVRAVAREQRLSLRRPARTAEQYLATLERCSLRRTAAALRPFMEVI